MATQRIALDWGVSPEFTARMEPASVEDANDLSKRPVGTIDDGSVDDGFWWELDNVPQELVDGSAPKLIVKVKTPAVTGNFQWLVNYRAIKTTATGEGGDPTTWQGTPNSGTIAVPGTARLYKEYPTAITVTDLAVDDLLIGEVLRHLSSNSGNDDTVADVGVIQSVFIEFTLA